MICPNCGKVVPDNSSFCSGCGANLAAPSSSGEKKKFFKGPSNKSKGYAAIMTALMVFPATFCIAIDLIFTRHNGWCGYVVGALVVAWVLSVFPVLRVTPAPVTAMICLFTSLSYLAYIIGQTGHATWYYKVGVPLFVLGAIFISVDSALFGAGKLKGLHVLSVILIEMAVYLVAIEITVDNLLFDMVTIRWSAILACFFVSAVALTEAVSYVIRLSKKK